MEGVLKRKESKGKKERATVCMFQPPDKMGVGVGAVHADCTIRRHCSMDGENHAWGFVFCTLGMQEQSTIDTSIQHKCIARPTSTGEGTLHEKIDQSLLTTGSLAVGQVHVLRHSGVHSASRWPGSLSRCILHLCCICVDTPEAEHLLDLLFFLLAQVDHSLWGS